MTRQLIRTAAAVVLGLCVLVVGDWWITEVMEPANLQVVGK